MIEGNANDNNKNFTMELKEFIKTALSDITNAVSELQAELQNGMRKNVQNILFMQIIRI